MNSGNTHIINKVFLEVNTSNKETAFKIKDDISSFLKENLFPYLEKYFSAFDEKLDDKIIKIPKLELDVSLDEKLNFEELKFDVGTKLNKQLTKIIKEPQLFREEKIILSKKSESFEDCFIYFIQKGETPWWFPEEQNLEITSDELKKISSKKPFKERLESILKNPVYRNRFVLQLKDYEFKIVILKMVEKEYHKSIIVEVFKSFEELKLSRSEKNSYKNFVLDFILNLNEVLFLEKLLFKYLKQEKFHLSVVKNLNILLENATASTKNFIEKKLKHPEVYLELEGFFSDKIKANKKGISILYKRFKEISLQEIDWGIDTKKTSENFEKKPSNYDGQNKLDISKEATIEKSIKQAQKPKNNSEFSESISLQKEVQENDFIDKKKLTDLNSKQETPKKEKLLVDLIKEAENSGVEGNHSLDKQNKNSNFELENLSIDSENIGHTKLTEETPSLDIKNTDNFKETNKTTTAQENNKKGIIPISNTVKEETNNSKTPLLTSQDDFEKSTSEILASQENKIKSQNEKSINIPSKRQETLQTTDEKTDIVNDLVEEIKSSNLKKEEITPKASRKLDDLEVLEIEKANEEGKSKINSLSKRISKSEEQSSVSKNTDHQQKHNSNPSKSNNDTDTGHNSKNDHELQKNNLLDQEGTKLKQQKGEIKQRYLNFKKVYSESKIIEKEKQEEFRKSLSSGEKYKGSNPQIISKEEVSEEGYWVQNAGLILIHPFIKHFLSNINLLNDKSEITDKTLAAHALHYLVTQKEKQLESNMLFEKFICKVPLKQSIEREVTITDEIKNEAAELLEAVLQNWEVLKNSSKELLQNEFLQRSGRLDLSGDNPKLTIERKTQDILLGKISWNIGLCKLPWHEKLIFTDWI